MERVFPQRLLSSSDITMELVNQINEATKPERRNNNLNCRMHTVCTLFYTASTRTRLSFERAIQDLDAKLLSVTNPQEVLSLSRGESFEDTIRTISYFADTLVLRHPEASAPARASVIAPNMVVINAGSGAEEHPTQTLIDLNVIWRRLLTDKDSGVQIRPYENLRVAYLGDVRFSRTAKSLMRVGHRLNWVQTVIAPTKCWPTEVELVSLATDCYNPKQEALRSTLPLLDVLYVIGRQDRERELTREHGIDILSVMNEIRHFKVTSDWLEILNPKAIIMHPLPRGNEAGVDSDPRSAIWDQVEAATPLRRQLLAHTWGSYYY